MEAAKKMRISEVIKPEDVTIDLTVPSKDRLLQALSEQAGHALAIDGRQILSALQNREQLGSTGIGAGIAIPHAVVAGIDVPFGLLVRLARPIEFDSVDDIPVDIVCLLLSPPDGQSAYLGILSCIARQLRSLDVVKRIRSAADREQLYSAITEGT